jgi:hypothetical protein
MGFRPADEKWKKMKAVWDACEMADTEVPQAVEQFFGGEAPDGKPGMEVELGEAVTEWMCDSESGYEVDLVKLPPDVRVLRFYNSW